jgi:hypothetical protein
MILKSKLNAKKKITAFGALVIPVLRYIFCKYITCRLVKVQKINRISSKIATIYKMHHPKAHTDRLYIKSKERGRGLLQIEATSRAETINTTKYFNIKYKED